jgi:cytochrome b involved in lipid metabolism
MALNYAYHLVAPEETQGDAETQPARNSTERIRFYSREEVALHNHPGSCWLIVETNVYDATSFVKKHPAGATCILRKAGKDATADFMFHKESSKRMWQPYFIGKLEQEACSCRVS